MPVKTQPSRRILVVEDNPSYQKAALKFLGDDPKVAFRTNSIHSPDYETAITALKEHELDGALIDCFFPRKRDSNDISLGYQALEELKRVCPKRFERSVLTKAVEQSRAMFGEQLTRFFCENIGVNPSRHTDYYKVIERAMQQNPSNQLLGILVAEEAKQKGIPFVMVTSTYHHDNLTQPIQDYCNKRGWTLFDCPQNQPNQKATPKFWKRAYDILEGKIG